MMKVAPFALVAILAVPSSLIGQIGQGPRLGVSPIAAHTEHALMTNSLRAGFDSVSKKHGGALPGAILGGLVGATLGVVAAGADSDHPSNRARDIAVGTLIGAAIGYFIGY